MPLPSRFLPTGDTFVTVRDLVEELGLCHKRVYQLLKEHKVQPAGNFGGTMYYAATTGDILAKRNTARGQCRRVHIPYIALRVRQALRAAGNEVDKANGYSYEFYTLTILPALVKEAAQFTPIGTRISNSGRLPAYSIADGIAMAKAAGWEITI
jgi:hypothetical protein